MIERGYNDIATMVGSAGPYVTTYGALYEQWRQMAHPSTWGTLTFSEWSRAQLNGQQVSWDAWVKANRSNPLQA